MSCLLGAGVEAEAGAAQSRNHTDCLQMTAVTHTTQVLTSCRSAHLFHFLVSRAVSLLKLCEHSMLALSQVFGTSGEKVQSDAVQCLHSRAVHVHRVAAASRTGVLGISRK